MDGPWERIPREYILDWAFLGLAPSWVGLGLPLSRRSGSPPAQLNTVSPSLAIALLGWRLLWLRPWGGGLGGYFPKDGVEQAWLDRDATPPALWEVWKHRGRPLQHRPPSLQASLCDCKPRLRQNARCQTEPVHNYQVSTGQAEGLCACVGGHMGAAVGPGVAQLL